MHRLYYLTCLFFLSSCVYYDLEEVPTTPPQQDICGQEVVSWELHILPIIRESCAISGCHNGISRIDLRKYELAKLHASEIKAFTQDRSMPFEGTITQQQINLIACWVDAGAPNN
ncbi:hypothetical protein [Chryseosolibacter indicus]|uniref:Cytochrome C Planctomycete-type domain-containing protein n=1 Tax=Chryseosolibacter indicus TaxID=2782351 RepID=A0ABS5VTX8_9BACT|nr:hypothetical protein [Chryseosolibacter indicus]MBT1703441.1 hypothetical protein [Chryseosolibacter indicus]